MKDLGIILYVVRQLNRGRAGIRMHHILMQVNTTGLP